jgi:NAD(P)H-hydrate epimerase
MTRLTRAQAREIDRLAAERYHMPSILLMENAARGAADVAMEMLASATSDGPVVVLCGGGNNGGDGLAIARHLHNRGQSVVIALTIDPQKCKGDALVNWQIVQAMKLSTLPAEPEGLLQLHPRLWIDAIFGTGLATPPRAGFDKIVAAVQACAGPILAVDLPSGMDCDTGEALGVALPADCTVTFVAEKAGFANPNAAALTGRIIVADIGCPRELLELVT